MRVAKIGIAYLKTIPIKAITPTKKRWDCCFLDKNTQERFIENNFPDGNKIRTMQSIQSVFKQANSELSITKQPNIMEMSPIIQKVQKRIEKNASLFSILTELYLFDRYTFFHSFRVMIYSLSIGIEIGLPLKELDSLGVGAILHDVGKIKTPKSILQKEGKLTDDEYEQIKKHPIDGCHLLNIVKGIPISVIGAVYQHHERIDGRGYPLGLKGNDIHLFGRIIAVADVFDAVTSERVYRKVVSPIEGMNFLISGRGTQFDGDIVQAFLQSFHSNGQYQFLKGLDLC